MGGDHMLLSLSIWTTALLALTWRPPEQPPSGTSGRQRAALALAGTWELDPARTRYGPGVERRRSERFACAARGGATVACTIRGERLDGRVITGRFTAAAGGPPAPVTGVPGVDAVQLYAQGSSTVHATFSLRGVPRFAYRAFRSADDRTLTIVSVDPGSRAALSTVVVYGRR